MAWRAPTENDLLGSISNAELAAYRAAVVADAQGDPVTARLAIVAEFVRGYIASNRENVLGAAGTLPETLIGPAMDYLAVDVIKRIPGRKIDPARDDARKAAITLFEQVASGKYAVSDPDSGAVAASSPTINEPERKFDHDSQDGI